LANQITINELKTQRRWVLWRLEEVHAKLTKVPYRPDGRKASTDRPDTWRTYAECAEVVSQYSGVGVVLGTVEGVSVWGVDLDACCDAATGEFTPESRKIVIELDSYGEYSPSGTGCHVLGLGTLPGKGVKHPIPGCKAAEVYADGRYFTFTGRHLRKTPPVLVERQEAVTVLYRKVANAKPQAHGLTVAVPVGEEERFQRLMAGDTSDHHGDHSAADFALCVLLAKKHRFNPFKMEAEFRESGLYREKWERDDYRDSTITKAIVAVVKETPVFHHEADTDLLDEDGETEFLVESDKPGADGWFPLGELSIIGGASGVGKTSLVTPMLERIRQGQDVWGHKTTPRDYRVLLHDRSKKAMRRTAKALRLTQEALQRVIRLTSAQQQADAADVLEAAIVQNPGVQVWFLEGLDLWIPDMLKMSVVGPAIDRIQRVATRYNVVVLASVGAPKQKGKDKYYGRDSLFGSAALARKVETVVLLSLHDEKNPNSVRACWVLPRTTAATVMYFTWVDGVFTQTAEPQEQETTDTALYKMTVAVRYAFGLDEPITHRPSIGSKSTFYRWREWAHDRGIVLQSKGKFYLSAASGVTAEG
jgi:hypothetical protein